MRNPMLRFGVLTFVAFTCALTGVMPAGALAPQPVDASEQGPFAFVLMTVMIVAFAFSMFYMDRLRQRRSDAAERQQQAKSE